MRIGELVNSTAPAVLPVVARHPADSADGVYCAGINSRMDRRDFGVLSGAGVVDLAFPRLALLPGCYVISAGGARRDASVRTSRRVQIRADVHSP